MGVFEYLAPGDVGLAQIPPHEALPTSPGAILIVIEDGTMRS